LKLEQITWVLCYISLNVYHFKM